MRKDGKPADLFCWKEAESINDQWASDVEWLLHGVNEAARTPSGHDEFLTFVSEDRECVLATVTRLERVNLEATGNVSLLLRHAWKPTTRPAGGFHSLGFEDIDDDAIFAAFRQVEAALGR